MIPNEIYNYYYSPSDLKSNMSTANDIICGISFSYEDPYNDGLLDNISQNRKVYQTLKKCSTKTVRIFNMFFADVLLDIQHISWGGIYTSYLISYYGLDMMKNLSQKSSSERIKILNKAAQNVRDAVSEYKLYRKLI